MAAPKGNKYNGYTLPELKKLCAAYAKHLSEGYSKEAFVDCDYRTVESAIEDNKELQSEKELISKALREGRQLYEKLGYNLANGKVDGNPTSWIFIMKNKFGWKDKTESDVNHSGGVTVISRPAYERK